MDTSGAETPVSGSPCAHGAGGSTSLCAAASGCADTGGRAVQPALEADPQQVKLGHGVPQLAGYPVVSAVPVRWGDMDALAHVNHAMYLRYFEAARIEYFERIGMGRPGPDWREYGFVIASLSCRYRAPVTYPDTLAVGVRVAAWGRDRLLMRYEAYSRALERVAAEAETLLVAYDFKNARPMSIRPEQREAILALEGREPDPLPRRRSTEILP